VELRFLTPKLIIGRHVPDEKTIERARADIAAAEEGIRSERFPAEPTYNACIYCPFHPICPTKGPD